MEKWRKQSASFLILLISLASLSGCDIGVGKPSEQEATAIIREARGYPMHLASMVHNIKENSGLGREILRLHNEGYLIFTKNYLAGSTVTDKGKNLVQQCNWNGSWMVWEVFSPFIYQVDVTKIDEILVDSQNRTAVVTFETGLSYTPYYYQLKKVDAEGYMKGDMPPLRDDVRVQKITLKKWDQGWRVLN